MEPVRCEVTVRNPRGIAVAIGCDGTSIFVDVDRRNTRDLEVLTEVFASDRNQIQITTEFAGQPPNTKLYDVVAGVSVAYQEVRLSDAVVLQDTVEDNRTKLGIRNTDLDR